MTTKVERSPQIDTFNTEFNELQCSQEGQSEAPSTAAEADF